MDLEDFSNQIDLAYNCFLCGNYKEVCPKDIDGKEIALSMRREHIKKHNNILKDKDYSLLFKRKECL